MSPENYWLYGMLVLDELLKNVISIISDITINRLLLSEAENKPIIERKVISHLRLKVKS